MFKAIHDIHVLAYLLKKGKLRINIFLIQY